MLKNKRQLYIFLLLLVVFSVVIFVNWNDDDNMTSQMTGQNDTTIASEVDKNIKGPQPIVGLDYAQNNQVICNPFSLAHETAADRTGDGMIESEPAPVKEKETPPSDTTVSDKARGDTLVKVNADERKESQATINLQGIMQGEGGALAILQVDNNTALVSQGDKLNNWQLSELGADYVVLEQAGQLKTLKLGKN